MMCAVPRCPRGRRLVSSPTSQSFLCPQQVDKTKEHIQSGDVFQLGAVPTMIYQLIAFSNQQLAGGQDEGIHPIRRRVPAGAVAAV